MKRQCPNSHWTLRDCLKDNVRKGSKREKPDKIIKLFVCRQLLLGSLFYPQEIPNQFVLLHSKTNKHWRQMLKICRRLWMFHHMSENAVQLKFLNFWTFWSNSYSRSLVYNRKITGYKKCFMKTLMQKKNDRTSEEKKACLV